MAVAAGGPAADRGQGDICAVVGGPEGDVHPAGVEVVLRDNNGGRAVCVVVVSVQGGVVVIGDADGGAGLIDGEGRRSDGTVGIVHRLVGVARLIRHVDVEGVVPLGGVFDGGRMEVAAGGPAADRGQRNICAVIGGPEGDVHQAVVEVALFHRDVGPAALPEEGAAVRRIVVIFDIDDRLRDIDLDGILHGRDIACVVLGGQQDVDIVAVVLLCIHSKAHFLLGLAGGDFAVPAIEHAPLGHIFLVIDRPVIDRIGHLLQAGIHAVFHGIVCRHHHRHIAVINLVVGQAGLLYDFRGRKLLVRSLVVHHQTVGAEVGDMAGHIRDLQIDHKLLVGCKFRGFAYIGPLLLRQLLDCQRLLPFTVGLEFLDKVFLALDGRGLVPFVMGNDDLIIGPNAKGQVLAADQRCPYRGRSGVLSSHHIGVGGDGTGGGFRIHGEAVGGLTNGGGVYALLLVLVSKGGQTGLVGVGDGPDVIGILREGHFTESFIRVRKLRLRVNSITPIGNLDLAAHVVAHCILDIELDRIESLSTGSVGDGHSGGADGIVVAPLCAVLLHHIDGLFISELDLDGRRCGVDLHCLLRRVYIAGPVSDLHIDHNVIAVVLPGIHGEGEPIQLLQDIAALRVGIEHLPLGLGPLLRLGAVLYHPILHGLDAGVVIRVDDAIHRGGEALVVVAVGIGRFECQLQCGIRRIHDDLQALQLLVCQLCHTDLRLAVEHPDGLNGLGFLNVRRLRKGGGLRIVAAGGRSVGKNQLDALDPGLAASLIGGSRKSDRCIVCKDEGGAIPADGIAGVPSDAPQRSEVVGADLGARRKGDGHLRIPLDFRQKQLIRLLCRSFHVGLHIGSVYRDGVDDIAVLRRDGEVDAVVIAHLLRMILHLAILAGDHRDGLQRGSKGDLDGVGRSNVLDIPCEGSILYISIVIKAFRFAVDLHLADTVVFVGSGLYRQGAALLHEDCFHLAALRCGVGFHRSELAVVGDGNGVHSYELHGDRRVLIHRQLLCKAGSICNILLRTVDGDGFDLIVIVRRNRQLDLSPLFVGLFRDRFAVQQHIAALVGGDSDGVLLHEGHADGDILVGGQRLLKRLALLHCPGLTLHRKLLNIGALGRDQLQLHIAALLHGGRLRLLIVDPD